MEQQPFKRVGQENFTTNPKIQQCWQKGGWGLVQGLKMHAGRWMHVCLTVFGTEVEVVSHLAEIS